jgi:hypothetical protein
MTTYILVIHANGGTNHMAGDEIEQKNKSGELRERQRKVLFFAILLLYEENNKVTTTKEDKL